MLHLVWFWRIPSISRRFGRVDHFATEDWRQSDRALWKLGETLAVGMTVLACLFICFLDEGVFSHFLCFCCWGFFFLWCRCFWFCFRVLFGWLFVFFRFRFCFLVSVLFLKRSFSSLLLVFSFLGFKTVVNGVVCVLRSRSPEYKIWHLKKGERKISM